jgi:hypothetical protein
MVSNGNMFYIRQISQRCGSPKKLEGGSYQSDSKNCATIGHSNKVSDYFLKRPKAEIAKALSQQSFDHKPSAVLIKKPQLVI